MSSLRMLCATMALLAAQAGAGPYVEKAGAADHPVVGRYKGSTLANFGSLTFERVSVPLGKDAKLSVEGKVFNYFYVSPEKRSELEVFRNFQLALEASHFKLLFLCDEPQECGRLGLSEHAASWTEQSRSFEGGYSPHSYTGRGSSLRYLVAQLKRPTDVLTVVLTVLPASSVQVEAKVGPPYFLQVIESSVMETGNVLVKAEQLGKGLAAEGKVALTGVFFDTGQATLKPESKPQLEEMAKFLATNPAVKAFVVGHTDNQGTVEANLALSSARAAAIVTALTQQYQVAAGRLQARGVANFAPLATNANEAGRAQNRRVELVQQ